MAKNDIDERIISWVVYLVENKVYKSEAEYLRTIGLGNAKLADARKGKAGFTTDNIRNILMNNRRLNARWLMTGEGDMIEEEADSASMNINVSKLLMMFNEKDQTCMKLLELNKNLEKEIQDLKHRLGDDEKAKVG